jgi:hypothetical protein
VCQVVHQIGRELQTSGIERYQLPPQPFVWERELNRVVDAARTTRESGLQRVRPVRRQNKENVSAFAQTIQFVQQSIQRHFIAPPSRGQQLAAKKGRHRTQESNRLYART